MTDYFCGWFFVSAPGVVDYFVCFKIYVYPDAQNAIMVTAGRSTRRMSVLNTINKGSTIRHGSPAIIVKTDFVIFTCQSLIYIIYARLYRLQFRVKLKNREALSVSTILISKCFPLR